MEWLNGIYDFIVGMWEGIKCFFTYFYDAVLDVLIGFYHAVVTLVISLFSLIPAPDAIMNFQWGTAPQVFMWAIHDLGLRDAMILVVAGATVKVTRQLLAMVAK